jgi:hypothetical protein
MGGKPINLLQVCLNDEYDSGDGLLTALWLIEHGFDKLIGEGESISTLLDRIQVKTTLQKGGLEKIARIRELISKKP